MRRPIDLDTDLHLAPGAQPCLWISDDVAVPITSLREEYWSPASMLGPAVILKTEEAIAQASAEGEDKALLLARYDLDDLNDLLSS